MDLLGKCDAYVARLPARKGMLKPGHNKFDFGWSLRTHQPDIVVHSLYPSFLLPAGALQAYSRGPDAYLGEVYADPVFQAGYADALALVHHVPLFLRAGSPERERLMREPCAAIAAPELLRLGLRAMCYPR